ncbi:MAG: hypothetical protein NE334_18565 [Lentisphaeraceae bacterium]|nr:hypothetical protein [Lentisphaeraceae bacterium]
MKNLKSLFGLALLGCFSFISSVVAEEPFRPKAGEFPPIEKAHTYRGELIFVDHATRRGSIRVQSTGMFRRNNPHPFALLPYGMVRYHGAPADLRDVPLGTVMHAKGYLPPDPKTSSVPIYPIGNKNKDMNHYRGVGVEPAENHILLLEDEPSYCQRNGLVWKLNEIEVKKNEWLLTGKRVPKKGMDEKVKEEAFTLDAATRIWRGRELLTPAEMFVDGLWPSEGKKSLKDQAVLLGLNFKPTPDGIFTRFHVTDIWLDDKSTERAAQKQREVHKAFIHARWVPAYVDKVEYGKYGRAKVTATLFGGLDESIYSEFKKDDEAIMNAVELTLKHTGASYGPAHISSRGKILDIKRLTGDIPMASSGVQIRFETDLIIEGIRKGRVVKVRPKSWPALKLPREEIIWNHGTTHEDRFPTPTIFYEYKP